MKNGKTLSAVLLALLTALQLWMLHTLMTNYAVTSLPVSMLGEIFMTLVVAAAAVLVFAKSGELTCGEKKALAASAVLYLVFTGIYYKTGLMIYQNELSGLGDGSAANGAAPYCILGIKALLLVAAVLAAAAPAEKAKKDAEPAAAETAPEAEPAEAEEAAAEEKAVVEDTADSAAAAEEAAAAVAADDEKTGE